MPDCENATSLCHDYHEDIKKIMLLDKTFPGRIKIVRYEDLNTRREEIMAKTYKFLNIKVNSQQLDKMHGLYKSNNKKKQFSKQ